MVLSDGVAPPESQDNAFTVRSAPTYGITQHLVAEVGIEPT